MQEKEPNALVWISLIVMVSGLVLVSSLWLSQQCSHPIYHMQDAAGKKDTGNPSGKSYDIPK